jgi:hypothetical protein
MPEPLTDDLTAQQVSLIHGRLQGNAQSLAGGGHFRQASQSDIAVQSLAGGGHFRQESHISKKSFPVSVDGPHADPRFAF